MSRRFGQFIVGKNLTAREEELVADFRSDPPLKEQILPAAEHIMSEADDDKELSVGFNGSIPFTQGHTQGQFDLDLPETLLDDLLRKYSKDTFAVWLAEKGTSNSKGYRKYADRTLAQDFESYEGVIADEKCTGTRPPMNEDGQVDEWALVELLESEGVTYDALCAMELRVLSYAQEPKETPQPDDRSSKAWWHFWR